MDYPGARRPDRSRTVDANGVSIMVHEWGDEDARPVLLAHGGFDFAETFDRFAPLIADGGWRVVAWDQRGHGDSEWAALYSWDADIRDGAAVVVSTSDAPVPLIGHSKGGGLAMSIADVRPDLISHVINLDGLPSRRVMPDVPATEQSKLLAQDLLSRLEFRRSAHEKQRRPGTLAELAERRGRMNPRLSPEWLGYLASVGSRPVGDLFQWKLDPSLRFGWYGPTKPEWGLKRMASLGMPMLAVLGTEVEEMGWGTVPSDVTGWLPPGARFEPLEGVGHFVHIEQPRLVADMVLEFLS